MNLIAPPSAEHGESTAWVKELSRWKRWRIDDSPRLPATWNQHVPGSCPAPAFCRGTVAMPRQSSSCPRSSRLHLEPTLPPVEQRKEISCQELTEIVLMRPGHNVVIVSTEIFLVYEVFRHYRNKSCHIRLLRRALEVAMQKYRSCVG